MKAIRFHEVGGPEVLVLDDVPDPSPAEGEVLIRVAAAGVNPTDAGTRSGRQQIPLPGMLGRECAGVVEAVGAGVTGLAVGDRVMARNTAYSYAELMTSPAVHTFVVPDNLDLLNGAVVPVTFATAWDAVANQCRVQAGETVLVHGAAGGVGIALVQVAKHAGATVIGTASSAERLEWAKGCGLDHGVNYAEVDFAQAVRDLTDGKGVDVVIDGVGGDVLLKSLECTAPHGRIGTYGSSAGRQVELTLGALSRTRLSLIGTGSSGTTRADFEQMLGLVADGTFKTTVDRTFPLADAAAAHTYLASRQVKGKVALTMGEN